MHCGTNGKPYRVVEYLLKENVLHIVGKGENKRLIWNPMLSTRGDRKILIFKARRLRKEKGLQNL